MLLMMLREMIFCWIFFFANGGDAIAEFSLLNVFADVAGAAEWCCCMFLLLLCKDGVLLLLRNHESFSSFAAAKLCGFVLCWVVMMLLMFYSCPIHTAGLV